MDLGNISNVLKHSEEQIQRVALKIPGSDMPALVAIRLNALKERQLRLEREVELIQQQNAAPLGFPFVIAAGAVLGISAVGGWVYKHFTDAKKLETQTSVYQDLRKDGTDPERAAAIVFGSATDFGDIMNKLIIISLIGAGVYVIAKVV